MSQMADIAKEVLAAARESLTAGENGGYGENPYPVGDPHYALAHQYRDAMIAEEKKLGDITGKDASAIQELKIKKYDEYQKNMTEMIEAADDPKAKSLIPADAAQGIINNTMQAGVSGTIAGQGIGASLWSGLTGGISSFIFNLPVVGQFLRKVGLWVSGMFSDDGMSWEQAGVQAELEAQATQFASATGLNSDTLIKAMQPHPETPSVPTPSAAPAPAEPAPAQNEQEQASMTNNSLQNLVSKLPNQHHPDIRFDGHIDGQEWDFGQIPQAIKGLQRT